MALASMPWSDWQFWVVTVIALAFAVAAARTLWPKSTKQTRVGLTVDRQPPAKP